MLKGFIVYTSEDAAYDELAGLDDFRNRNLHPEHNGDIDLVRYENVGMRFISSRKTVKR